MSTSVLLRERLRLPVQAGRRLVSTALLLDRAPEPVRAALAAGVISVEQAMVIAETVADLPTGDVATETAGAAVREPGDAATQATDATGTTDATQAGGATIAAGGADNGDIAGRATDRYHHRTVHHTGWQVRLATDGHPEFLPPAWLDPDQHPRRNPTTTSASDGQAITTGPRPARAGHSRGRASDRVRVGRPGLGDGDLGEHHEATRPAALDRSCR